MFYYIDCFFYSFLIDGEKLKKFTLDNTNTSNTNTSNTNTSNNNNTNNNIIDIIENNNNKINYLKNINYDRVKKINKNLFIKNKSITRNLDNLTIW